MICRVYCIIPAERLQSGGGFFGFSQGLRVAAESGISRFNAKLHEMLLLPESRKG